MRKGHFKVQHAGFSGILDCNQLSISSQTTLLSMSVNVGLYCWAKHGFAMWMET